MKRFIFTAPEAAELLPRMRKELIITGEPNGSVEVTLGAKLVDHVDSTLTYKFSLDYAKELRDMLTQWLEEEKS